MNATRQRFTVIVMLLLPYTVLAQTTQQYPKTEKPWTYWWWMGSAVDKPNITHHLEAFASNGFGGVHIIPIYGVKGYESAFIPFITVRWMSMLEFTIAEGSRLGLGVDMTMGTGWPFGGPQVLAENSAKRFTIENGQFKSSPTGQKVKRAAPGGEGFVLDHFDKPAVQHYLNSFETPLSKVRNKLRSLYNDSYEVYGANWTTDFLQTFKKKRGYDLQEHLKDFLDTTNARSGLLVKIDYHQTIAELLHDGFTATWTSWSKKQSFITRNQAHGSPGNLIDLYALVDIPETESFGTSAFSIPGLRIDDHYEESRFGTPDPLAMKFATSAANLTNKRLVSSETGTWLGDHFKVSLSQVKPQLDELFTAGINHVFYHGITYSPKEEGFPGWLFYASTNFGLQSHVWKHIGLLNNYVASCQHALQNSEGDNEILLYFPIHDLWATRPRAEGGIHLLEVHHTKTWLRSSAFGTLASSLYDKGFTFDYVSDSLLLALKVENKKIISGNTGYKAIVVPPATFIPARTVQILNTLSKQGAVVIFQDHLPEGCTGFLQNNATTFQSDLLSLQKKARVVKTNDLIGEFERLGIKREGFSENGLSFIRKRQLKEGHLYFVSNLKNQFSEGWVTVASTYPGYKQYDPLSGSEMSLPVRTNAQGKTEVFLDLPPGKSCFLVPDKNRNKKTEVAVRPRKILLKGKWSVHFENGLPEIRDTYSMNVLKSWTTLSDSASYFYGTATYTLDFSVPDSVLKYKSISLDLGNVCEVATVTLNGKNIGTAWSIPYRVEIPAAALLQKNTLEIQVSNVASNYMRLYDRIHPEWKKFYDINIVDIQYKPYDGSKSAIMPSGLTSEVSLVYR